MVNCSILRTCQRLKIRGIEVEDRYIDEQIDPKDRKPWVTAMQITCIWTGTEFAFIGCRFGDVASRDISVDVRRLIEEKIPLIKRKYEPKPDMTRENKKHEK